MKTFLNILIILLTLTVISASLTILMFVNDKEYVEYLFVITLFLAIASLTFDAYIDYIKKKKILSVAKLMLGAIDTPLFYSGLCSMLIHMRDNPSANNYHISNLEYDIMKEYMKVNRPSETLHTEHFHFEQVCSAFWWEITHKTPRRHYMKYIIQINS